MIGRDPDNSDIIGALQLLLSKKIWFIITSGNFPLQKTKKSMLTEWTKKRYKTNVYNLEYNLCYIIKVSFLALILLTFCKYVSEILIFLLLTKLLFLLI